MACENMTEALLEDVIEITWMFDSLVDSGKIKSWDEILDQEDGSDGIKNTIKCIAQEFEKKYPFDTTWEDTELDYIEEIEKFAKEKLVELYGIEKNETDMTIEFECNFEKPSVLKGIDIWGAAFLWVREKEGAEYNFCIDENGENCSAIYKMIEDENGIMYTDHDTFFSL